MPLLNLCELCRGISWCSLLYLLHKKLKVNSLCQLDSCCFACSWFFSQEHYQLLFSTKSIWFVAHTDFMLSFVLFWCGYTIISDVTIVQYYKWCYHCSIQMHRIHNLYLRCLSDKSSQIWRWKDDCFSGTLEIDMCEQWLLSETIPFSDEQIDRVDECWDSDANKDWLLLSLKPELVASDDPSLL